MSVYERQSATDRAIGIISRGGENWSVDESFRGGGIVGAMLLVCNRSRMRMFFVKRWE